MDRDEREDCIRCFGSYEMWQVFRSPAEPISVQHHMPLNRRIAALSTLATPCFAQQTPCGERAKGTTETAFLSP